MTKKYSYSACLLLTILFITGIFSQPSWSQDAGVEIKGVVTESGTGNPLEMVTISVSSTGASSSSDSTGAFTLTVPDLQAQIIVNMPGYTRRNIYLNGRESIQISIVPEQYRTLDHSFNHPLGSTVSKDAVYPVTSVPKSEMDLTSVSSFDQALQGKVPGMSVVRRNGSPGSRTFMNVRGYSSLFANNEPILFME